MRALVKGIVKCDDLGGSGVRSQAWGHLHSADAFWLLFVGNTVILVCNKLGSIAVTRQKHLWMRGKARSERVRDFRDHLVLLPAWVCDSAQQDIISWSCPFHCWMCQNIFNIKPRAVFPFGSAFKPSEYSYHCFSNLSFDFYCTWGAKSIQFAEWFLLWCGSTVELFNLKGHWNFMNNVVCSPYVSCLKSHSSSHGPWHKTGPSLLTL